MDQVGREVFVRSPRVAFRRIGDSFVLVNIEDNRILRLNETGTEIWGLLDGRDVGAVAAAIAERFAVEAGAALADAREFLGLLESRGLVERA